MERAWLEARLAEGRSIESIAKEVGKSPSTVGYWVKKYGLVSSHAERHAARGGIPREVLERLVAGGRSSHKIARELGVSQTTVRHWLKQHGLETRRASQLVERGTAVRDDDGVITAECARHGVTRFGPRGDGGFRCLACRSEAVVTRRRLVKATLVAEAGGRCLLCGYDRSVAALQFHHLDRTTKEFHISRHGVARSLARARAEAAKCVLLCANCHAEVESGIATIPPGAPGSPG
jgi:transposase-like protein